MSPSYSIEETYESFSPTKRGYHVKKNGWSQMYTTDKAEAEAALKYYQSKEKP